jgi:uncharacterized protein DUF6448
MRMINFTALVALIAAFALPESAHAHCDSLDGPVVRDARAALESGDSTIVRKWVAVDQEPELLEVFGNALAVRTLGAPARDVADRLFFETLVRLHRASEGEAFTGLKPAGSVDPGLQMADAALAAGSVRDLVDDLGVAVRQAVEARFAAVQETERHAGDNVAAGRAYVKAYVEYAHLVEQLHGLAIHGATAPHHEPLAIVHAD